MPALMYRRNREPWRVLIAAADLLPAFADNPREDLAYTVTMAPEAFAMLVRARL
jgi:hypothetical protein